DDMELDQLLLELEEMKRKKNTNAYFIVDTLTNLQKGGRLTNAQAMIGSLLKVKPILEFQDAQIVPYEKIRTKKKAMKKVEDVFETEMERHKGKPVTAVVIHSNAEAEAEEWLAALREKHPEVTFRLSYFGPVIGTHLGEGALGLGYTTYEVDTEVEYNRIFKTQLIWLRLFLWEDEKMIIKHMKGEIYMDSGVDPDKYVCHRCSNDVKRYFYKYYSGYHGTDVVDCLKCLHIARSARVTLRRLIHTAEKAG